MNIEHYENFSAVVDCGSISAAARKLCIAQSALSKQMQMLEQYFGTPLLIRKARSVEPTESGMILYNHAKALHTLEHSVKQEITDVSLGTRGTLKIGMAPSNPDRYLEKICLSFHRESPLSTFEFYEAHSPDVLNMLRTGVVEIGFIRLPEAFYPNIKLIGGTTAHTAVVFPRDNPWGQIDDGAPLTLKDLRGIPLSITRGFQNSLMQAFHDANETPKFFCISSSRSGSLVWANNGMAAAIVIMEDLEAAQTKTTFGKPLYIPGEDKLTRSFVIRNDRPLSQTAERFVSFLYEHWDDTLY